MRNQIAGTCIWIPCTFQKGAIMVTSKKSRDVLQLGLAVVLSAMGSSQPVGQELTTRWIDKHHNGHYKDDLVVQELTTRCWQPGIDINILDHDGECALHSASFNDNHEAMKLLLAQNDLTTINHRNWWVESWSNIRDEITPDMMGRTPIMQAVARNAVKCFHLLLTDPRVDLDVRDDYQRSPEEVNRLVFWLIANWKRTRPLSYSDSLSLFFINSYHMGQFSSLGSLQNSERQR